MKSSKKSKTTIQEAGGPQIEPTLLPETSFRLATLGGTYSPSVADLQKSIETLTAMQVRSASRESPGEEGDIFLFYDITLVNKGKDPFHYRGVKELRDVISMESIAEAPEMMDIMLLELVRPLKTRANRWVADFTSNI